MAARYGVTGLLLLTLCSVSALASKEGHLFMDLNLVNPTSDHVDLLATWEEACYSDVTINLATNGTDSHQIAHRDFASNFTQPGLEYHTNYTVTVECFNSWEWEYYIGSKSIWTGPGGPSQTKHNGRLFMDLALENPTSDHVDVLASWEDSCNNDVTINLATNGSDSHQIAHLHSARNFTQSGLEYRTNYTVTVECFNSWQWEYYTGSKSIWTGTGVGWGSIGNV